MPEGRETRKRSDYVSHLSGISRIKRTVAAQLSTAAQAATLDSIQSPESLIHVRHFSPGPIKDSGFRIQSGMAACAAARCAIRSAPASETLTS